MSERQAPKVTGRPPVHEVRGLSGGRRPGRREAPARVAALVRLAHHRWCIPVLAELGPRGGARISELAHRIGGSRLAVRQAADALGRMGLVAAVTGHGHPLRPEVVLTDAGLRVTDLALQLEDALTRTGVTELARRKWTLPALLALGQRPRRYGEVRRALPGITDRALSGALRDLERSGLASREVLGDAPPATRYRLTASARPVASAADALLSALPA